MTDREAICQRLHALETYVAELQRLIATVSRDKFTAELSTQWMIEHGLQLAIECVLDIGNHLVAGEQLGTPQSYREIIELLGQHGILPEDFVARVRGMPGFRNILVHDYLAVDPSMVWVMLHEGPAQFREFISHIAAHLRTQSSPGKR
ncbi:MAG: DUF86 domain-containing protein [Candidatus Binatia bacterium]|jgi:uncharacterized protein YutE (UPF0331/DUF86 family)